MHQADACDALRSEVGADERVDVRMRCRVRQHTSAYVSIRQRILRSEVGADELYIDTDTQTHRHTDIHTNICLCVIYC
jgi:hypothetical protein